MKAILLSVRPQWCELIANGKKTIEVRKSRPKLETPFKCYIYCTLSGSPEAFESWGKDVAKWNRENWGERKGKVMGEFICDNIKAYFWDDFIGAEDLDGTIREKAVAGEGTYWIQESECLAMCLSLYNEILPYGNGKTLYGWHISALQIYDKPMELSEFTKFGYDAQMPCCRLTRPFQSWGYVEEYDGKR